MAPKLGLVAVSLLTAVAFAVRLAGIDQTIFGDERLLYEIVADNSLGDALEVVADTEKTPPLHFLLAWAAGLVLDPTTWTRLPSLVLGTAAVPLVYLLGLRTVGRNAGIAAAAVVALAPFSIFYGIENRAYATLTFLSALSTLTLLAALDRNRPRWWLAYGACVAAVLYTHYTGIFVVLAQLGWALWTHRERARQLGLAHVAVALAFVPWLPSFFTQLDHSSTEATRLAGDFPLSVETILEMIGHTLPGYPFVPLDELPGHPVVVVVWGTIGIALVAAAVRLERDRLAGQRGAVTPELALIGVLTLATPVGVVLYSIQPDTSFLLSRNLSASLPAFALAVGWLLTSLRPPFALAAVGLVVAGLCVGAVKSFDDDLRRTPYRQVAQFIDARARPGDAVVNLSTNPLSVTAFAPAYELEIYFDRQHPIFGIGNAQEAWARAARGRSVFLVSPRVGLLGHFQAFSGPGNRFLLRESRLFRGELPIAVARYAGEMRARLVTGDGRPIIRWSLGADIVVSRTAAQGSVDKLSVSAGELTVAGWATDLAEHRPVDWILAFVRGRLVAFGRPETARPDVARANGKSALLSGFTLIALDARRPVLSGPSRLRVFAVDGDRATELDL